MKTLLIESLGRVGGISTSGLMSHFTGNVDSNLYREILTKSAEKNYFEKIKYRVRSATEYKGIKAKNRRYV
ncbi:MAG: FAD-dependent oxidoreductase [Clostridia bacterium]|nr:FAD-dependent oxidoreductase [Clostridia bacterium]